MYLWPDGFVRFLWSTKGNVQFTRCKLDGGPEMPCQSGLQYDVNDVTAGTHRVEIIAYCKNEPSNREIIGFRCEYSVCMDLTILCGCTNSHNTCNNITFYGKHIQC